MDNPLTLQEAKDQVAKDNGWDNWNHIRFSESLSQEAKDILFSMAAELYARSKWDEACEAQRKLCYRAYMDQPIVQGKDKFEGISNEMEAIINAPKSEFKP